MSFHNTWRAIIFRVRHNFWLGELNDIYILGIRRKNVTPWTIFGNTKNTLNEHQGQIP